MLHVHDTRTSRSRFQMASSGLIEGSFYRSPRFGHEVNWTHPWTVLGADGSAASMAVPETDQIVLGTYDPGLAEVEIAGADRRNLLNSAETMRFWASPAYVTEFMDPGTKVVLSQYCAKTAAVMMVSPGETSTNPVVTVKESCDYGHRFSIRMTFSSDLASFHDAFRSLRENVLIDRRKMLRCCSVDVLREVLS